MKNLCLLLVALCTFLCLSACDAADPRQSEAPDDAMIADADPAAKTTAEAPALTVAFISAQTGQIVLLKDRLRKTFPDGGPIRALRIEKLIDGYNLIRIGQEADGTCRTEALPLVQTGRRLDLSLDDLAQRLYCRSTTCETTSSSFTGECQPSFNKMNCPCSLGGDCGIGLMQFDDLAVLVFDWI